ncbi:disulfide isomerase-like protein 2-3 [Tanacetum coccineum]
MNHQLLSKKLLLISVVIGLLFCLNIEIVDAFYGSGSNVVQLTPNNFKSKVVNSNSVVLVEFYASWCGHCKSLTPTWERAATILKGVATVAAIDADAHKTIAQEYGIQGFPTIKVFVPGKPPVDYQGARDAKPIAEFALKQVKALLKDRLSGKSTVKPEESSEKKSKSEPSASVELNSNNFDELVVKSKDVWMVEFFAPCLPNKGIGAISISPASFLLTKQALSSLMVYDWPFFETLLSVAEKFKKSPYRCQDSVSKAFLDTMDKKCFGSIQTDLYVWAAAGKQPELEKHVGVGGYGYPALIALNVKKGAYAPLKGAFEREQMMDLRERRLTRGKTERSSEEDEFSLEELMGDSTAEKDEL